jgi:hypothetical protein
MSEYTKDEALAFIEAMRLALAGKVGFKWLVERLSGLSGYIESLAADNDVLNAYLDSANVRADYESYRADPAEKTGAGDDRAQPPVPDRTG